MEKAESAWTPDLGGAGDATHRKCTFPHVSGPCSSPVFQPLALAVEPRSTAVAIATRGSAFAAICARRIAGSACDVVVASWPSHGAIWTQMKGSTGDVALNLTLQSRTFGGEQDLVSKQDLNKIAIGKKSSRAPLLGSRRRSTARRAAARTPRRWRRRRIPTEARR